MNYINQINGFWVKAELDNITSIDIAVYMAILKYCNSLNWLNPFICHWDIICQYSKCSKNAFYTSIKRLDSLKYIEYTPGQRNKLQPKIVVLEFKNNKGTIKEQNREQHEEQKGNLYKQVNNKTIKLINSNYKLVNENLEIWIKSTNPKNEIPELIEFEFYAIEKKPLVDLVDLKLKYESWIENDWKDGNGKSIKNWKSKLLNTLPYIKEKNSEKKESQIGQALSQAERLYGNKETKK